LKSFNDNNEKENEEEDDDFHSKDPFATTDPFESANTGGGFDAIIGNNNISNNPLYGYHITNGYDQSNDFLMNFYASQCTNYSPFATTINTCNTNIPPHNSSSYSHALNSCSSSYNPFHQHFCALTSSSAAINNSIAHNIDDVNSNNDNWANFDSSSSDNFADFDSHFASITPTNPVMESNATANPSMTDEEKNDEGETHDEATIETPCFVSTTQVLEISSVPPQQSSPIRFQLGPNVTSSTVDTSTAAFVASVVSSKAFDDLDDEEFFSLRDDSNSLTDDIERKFTFENTEIPDDDDDDFASADER
jgi:hypothetical protein